MTVRPLEWKDVKHLMGWKKLGGQRRHYFSVIGMGCLNVILWLDHDELTEADKALAIRELTAKRSNHIRAIFKKFVVEEVA